MAGVTVGEGGRRGPGAGLPVTWRLAMLALLLLVAFVLGLSCASVARAASGAIVETVPVPAPLPLDGPANPPDVMVLRGGVHLPGQAGLLPLDATLGLHARIWRELPGQRLGVADAQRILAEGRFMPSDAAVPNLGNGAPPLWLHLSIENPGREPLPYRLYSAQGWVDRVDAWIIVPGASTMPHWSSGDERSPSRYLRPGLGFAYDAMLPPGRTELFVRSHSVNSAPVALRLVPLSRTASIESAASAWIGLVHGFLMALVLTYGLLWIGLRERSHLRYVAYVGAYLTMYLAYSGIGARWVWPDLPLVQRYATFIGMVLFAAAGLNFGRSFLGLSRHAAWLDKAVMWTVRGALLLMAIAVLANATLVVVHIAFAFILLFTFGMVGMGVYAMRHQREQASIFLAATLVAMVGTLVTTLAIKGVLPLNALTFRAVEVGVMLEAAIWALALGVRLRRQQHDGARAMALAHRDPLTGLNNRRGFLEQALPVWSTADRKGRPLAAILLDIDHFKHINDRHGHAAGDRVLVDVSDRLGSACRSGDILARWGGEEFVMLLPETDSQQAGVLAERLRELIAAAPVALGDGRATAFTASFGVAVRLGSMTLDELLRAADTALYAAKDGGRDRVVVASVPPAH